MLLRHTKYLLLLSFGFLLSCSPLKVQKTDAQHTVIGEAPIDSATYKIILPYKQGIVGKMNEGIGTPPEALVKNLPESPLGNFFSDAIFKKALSLQGADTVTLVALFNTGGLRTSVPKGEVQVRNIYELMPFENELVFLTLKGSELLNVLHFISENGGAPVAGVRFTISNKKAENVFVHNTALDTTQNYMIATSDYLANGGDKIFSVVEITNYRKTGILLRDILIEHCKMLHKQNKVITAVTDGRISIAK